MTEEQIFTDIRFLDESHIDNSIWLRGRVHTIRKAGRMCFIVLRYQTYSIQAVADKKVVGESFNELVKVTSESLINLKGILKISPFEIKFTSHKFFELQVESWNLVSMAGPLPFGIDDANNFGETFRSDVGNQTRYDNRCVDLRIPVNVSIFKIQSKVGELFRRYMLQNNFTEIHTPKTIGTASEGGANVFELKYFDQKAYLAQSPQLYKQMAINADFYRVFEIGPIFRAEYSFSNRHLCEFTGLDLEMEIIKDHSEIMNILWGTLVSIFDGLKNECARDLEIVREKLPFENPIYPNEPLIINFKDGVQMINESGYKQDPMEDLSGENEKKLGELVKIKYNSDLFILYGYPRSVRPFYTKVDPNDPNYTVSWDIIFRGQEISSGAQRENNYDVLLQQIKDTGVNPETLTDYLKSFTTGSPPHGGSGFGLERIVTFFLALTNIRQASFCPRDPKRLNP